MKLRELKREIDSLKNVDKTIVEFRTSWLKKIKRNTNQHFPFLLELDKGIKKEVNNNLFSYQKIFSEFRHSHFTQEKLSSLAKYLVDLKLASINEDKKKSKLLIDKFIKDDFLNLKKVVSEVSDFDFNLKNMKTIYDQTNKIIVKELQLEESVIFMDASHKDHLNSLLLVSKKQKKLLKVLGKEFISLVRSMKKRK